MKIIIDVDIDNNEGTDSPWWIIIDPKQNMSTKPEACNNIASMITGPFFSRENAQNHLLARRHAFGPNAVVYYMSGYWSFDYKTAIRRAMGKE